jgi:histidine triad (HIT) family protein
MSEKTVFKKIIDGEIPAKKVYEDELCIAFNDIAPKAPTHLLVIPKKEVRDLDALTAEDQMMIGHLMLVISKVALQVGLTSGYRVVTNIGSDGGQEVPHLHFHILGKRKMTWPPG